MGAEGIDLEVGRGVGRFVGQHRRLRGHVCQAVGDPLLRLREHIDVVRTPQAMVAAEHGPLDGRGTGAGLARVERRNAAAMRGLDPLDLWSPKCWWARGCVHVMAPREYRRKRAWNEALESSIYRPVARLQPGPKASLGCSVFLRR